MASSQDTEITLGTGKLLVLFFGLVAVCALFFALGYSLGRRSEPAITTANAAGQPIPTSGKTSTGSQPATPMTFYKSVEQKDVNPQLTSPGDAKTQTPAAPAETNSAQTPAAPDSSTALPTSGYFVQVAAVSREEDAQALVEALKKKDYPAFISPAGDKLFRVQVGPYNEIKDAEAMRTRLIAEGYSPIVKK
ncbi:MAG TPA: SPOR domain-containing protein [Verrucomicrobiae bacterium]|jgi:DedD protein|nr:SPOR domain-containing protein [Verrucomicrobiae bacterium]